MLKSNEKAIIYLKRIRPYHCAVSRKKTSFFVNVWKCPHTSNCTWKLSHALPDGFTS